MGQARRLWCEIADWARRQLDRAAAPDQGRICGEKVKLGGDAALAGSFGLAHPKDLVESPGYTRVDWSGVFAHRVGVYAECGALTYNAESDIVEEAQGDVNKLLGSGKDLQVKSLGVADKLMQLSSEPPEADLEPVVLAL